MESADLDDETATFQLQMPPMQPLHEAAVRLLTPEVRDAAEDLIHRYCISLFQDLPETVAIVEDERLNSAPPRSLQVSQCFQEACDARGAAAMHSELCQLLLRQGQESISTDVASCCDFALTWETYDACLAFEGVEAMFLNYDRALVVKLLASICNYSAFLSMMYELHLEIACTTPDAARLSVIGSSMLSGTCPQNDTQEN